MERGSDSDLYVSQRDYDNLIDKLARNIRDSKWRFNQIVAIAKGGLRPGDILTRLFDVPFAVLSVESYGNSGEGIKDQQGQITFSRDLALTRPNLGSHVLLVDDLADSGTTLEKSVGWMQHNYGFFIEELRTAVLWKKKSSLFTPDYIAMELDGDQWIHQPFEKYEKMRPEDL